MKALSYCKPLLSEAEKISCREIYWEKNILRCTFTRKKISVLFPWAEKKIIAQSEFSNSPPPSKVKWSAP
jgi:hypothetical protein